jgi:L-asparaginase / beta-aspartyl-peptidase
MRISPCAAILIVIAANVLCAQEPKIPQVVLAVHGGTGVVTRKEMTPAVEKEYREKLEESLRAGYQALRKPGATSLDGVEAAIRVLEDSPLFNAGRGAVFTADGRNELDASIMDGRNAKAGAVAAVTNIKNPITAARAVMEKSPHVLLVGPGAEAFAKSAGIEIVDPKWFWTERRWKELQEWKKARDNPQSSAAPPLQRELSTVGAVAVDADGNLAAGTSTGGMTGKLFGRLGGVPIIGAGTYADNQTCAVSGTGHGEYFIRYQVAYDIAALMKYKGLAVAQAAHEVVQNKVKQAGGEAGIIALDRSGNLAMPFNSEGLYRGYITRDGQARVFVYEE